MTSLRFDDPDDERLGRSDQFKTSAEWQLSTHSCH
jgi:hypothetical protein